MNIAMVNHRVPLYLQVKERIRKEFTVPADIALDDESRTARLPTLEELQLRIQVSRPTISKALAALAAEGFLIKEKGRGTFALANYGIAPNNSSQQSVQAPTVGFIAPLFGAELPQRTLAGIDRIAYRRGYRVVMAGSGDNVVRERATAHEMIARGVSGLIIYPTIRKGKAAFNDYLCDDAQRKDEVSEFDVPVVLVDTATPSQGHAQVLFDNRRAGYQVVKWLIEQERNRVGIILYSESTNHPSLEDRLQGYRSALVDAGIGLRPEYIIRVEPPGVGRQVAGAVEQFLNLSLDCRPQAIIAADDIMAIAVIKELAAREISVPQDMHVFGFDNRLEARHFEPSFPTTSPDFESLGEVACDMLIDGIETGLSKLNPRTYIISVPLLVRDRHSQNLYSTVVEADNHSLMTQTK